MEFLQKNLQIKIFKGRISRFGCMLRKGSHDVRITNHTEASVWYQNGQFSKSLNRVAQTSLAMV